jgi:hypothetical protein
VRSRLPDEQPRRDGANETSQGRGAARSTGTDNVQARKAYVEARLPDEPADGAAGNTQKDRGNRLDLPRPDRGPGARPDFNKGVEKDFTRDRWAGQPTAKDGRRYHFGGAGKAQPIARATRFDFNPLLSENDAYAAGTYNRGGGSCGRRDEPKSVAHQTDRRPAARLESWMAGSVSSVYAITQRIARVIAFAEAHADTDVKPELEELHRWLYRSVRGESYKP